MPSLHADGPVAKHATFVETSGSNQTRTGEVRPDVCAKPNNIYLLQPREGSELVGLQSTTIQMQLATGPRKPHVGVIGAGPAGLAAALKLAQGGCQVDLFEASGHVGGLCRSFDLWGAKVDMGPHRFFSKDARINKFWLEQVGGDYLMVDRLTRIFYKKRFFHYPLRPFNALVNMGAIEAGRCVASYGMQSAKNRMGRQEPNELTFEGWVVKRFGRRLFELFFKSYSEKLWGIPCTQLDADFAAQRIKKFSLGAALLNAAGMNRQRHATLVDKFAYPTEGAGMAYERMAANFEQLGGRLHLKRPVKRILHEGFEVRGLELLDGSQEKFDHVVTTMPFTLMVKGLTNVPEPVRTAVNRLKFRNTILVYLLVDGEHLFPDQWLYIHSPELKTGRITNFGNWAPATRPGGGKTIVALEYWCYDEDSDWSATDEDLIDRAKIEFVKTGLSGGHTVSAGHVERIRRCYPVYESGYKDNLAVILPYLKRFNGLTPIGRYGSFKYNNQDHSLLMGMLAAENILTSSGQNDLWSINTDFDGYQEEAIISERGLELVSA